MPRYLLLAILVVSIVFLAVPAQQPAQDQPPARPQEAGVSIGLVIDDSGSMINKKKASVEAMLEFVRASGPQDEFFVIHFNDDAHLDQDFTMDKDLVYKALRLTDFSGHSALNDAILASADHLRKSSKYRNRVLVLMTDGPDNQSHASTQQMLQEFGKPGTPPVYSIGLFNPGRDEGRKALEALSKASSGIAYFPKDPPALDEIMRRLAKEIHKR